MWRCEIWVESYNSPINSECLQRATRWHRKSRKEKNVQDLRDILGRDQNLIALTIFESFESELKLGGQIIESVTMK